ncbi:MAG: hypothetical protein AAGC74_06055, partial [Verrucomicrobiota bacterium]
EPLKRLSSEEKKKARRKSLKRRNSGYQSVILMASLWIAALGGVFFVFSFLKNKFVRQGPVEISMLEQLSGEERAFYQAESPKIRELMRSFLSSQAVEGRASLSKRTRNVPGVMGTYYTGHSMKMLSGNLSEEPLFWNVVYKEKPSYVEVVWRDDGGNDYEAVLVKDNSLGWRLDWAHFVRYSKVDWTYFRQKFGTQRTGVFRLYVEEVADGGEMGSSRIFARFYPAKKRQASRRMEASPEVEIQRNSQAGMKLATLFQNLDEERKGRGWSRLKERDDEGLHRVIAELAWEEDERTGKETLELIDILATNWRGEGLNQAEGAASPPVDTASQN